MSKVLLLLLAGMILLGGYMFYSRRYGKGWNQAAEDGVDAMISSRADFLQDIYRLTHAPPEPDAIGGAVIKDARLQVKEVKDDPKSVNFKTIHAHVIIEALPALFQNEASSTGSLSTHAEGDYVFMVTRSFWPAPVMFLPDAERIDVQWRREEAAK